MNQQIQELITALDTIADELQAPSPKKGTIQSIYQSLLNTWVPGVITSVVGNLITRVIF